jgi:nitrile hydratase subunit beta
MNGVHDMGGMQDMGPIRYEKNEPVFHAPWEARVYGLMRTLGAQGKWNLDAFRHQIELIPPADYLRMSYYEKWLASLSGLAVKTDLVTAAEIDSGKAAPDRPKAMPRVTAANAVAVAMTRPAPLAKRDLPGAPKFKAGERVRARNINPLGHTRLPRYARGKTGTIERDYGAFVFPDTNAHFLGEKPQHVYSVRFSARELWGQQAPPRDAVYIDVWDDYLEHA